MEVKPEIIANKRENRARQEKSSLQLVENQQRI